MSTPTGNNAGMDRFNDQLRANPQYRAFLQSIGVNPNGPIRLSGSQRSQAERFVRQLYPQLAGKFQIDPAGNTNTDHGASTAWSNPYFRYPLLAAGAVGTAGALGAFGGAASAGSAAAGGATAAGTSAIPGAVGAAGALGVPGVVTGGGAGAGGFFSSLAGFGNSAAGRELIGLGGQFGGALLQNNAANNAAEIQDRYLRDALAFEKERDARQSAQYLEERNRGWQREEARDGRLAPFRANGGRAYQQLSGLLTRPEAYLSPNRSIPQRKLADLL